ncbi:MAG: cation:proton antiporter [Pseudobdellovibrionaceae bacterium]
MLHLPDLIRDLAIILVTASIVVLVFKKLKQPVVLGYLVAGFLVGPHFDLFPTVKETKNIQTWAEIGVIFMLFGLGLEFSFKKLFKVGKSAAITASFEVLFMLGVGFILGQSFGFNKMDSLFLGGILSISSTTIIVRAFDEMGLKARSFVSLVFGVLIVEDLIAILLLVVLSSVAVTQTFSGEALVFSSLKLIFFLIIWFILGIYFLPTLLNRARNVLTDETVLVVAIGLCLMMVLIASQVGFSPALGAFVMGSLFAETREGRRIEDLILPIKDLFSAVFFVSVGMLIDFSVVKEHAGIILIVTLVTVFGKFLSSTLGALLAGVNVRNSVQAGLSLAQIGEFSFIIATLGLTLKVTSDFLYPLAVVVSAVTTLLTPYLIRSSTLVAQFIENRIPANARARMTLYQNAMQANTRSGPIHLLWKEYGIKILFNSVVVIALGLFVNDLLFPHFQTWFYSQFGQASESVSYFLNGFILVLTLLVCSPFLWAICLGKASHQNEYDAETVHQLKKLQFGVALGRLLIGGFLTLFLVGQHMNVLATSGLLVGTLLICFLFLFSRRSEKMYQMVESRFLVNLSENEKLNLEKKQKFSELAPWDYSLTQITVSQNSTVVGSSLEEIRMREKYGISIVLIQRGNKKIFAPSRSEKIYPFDHLFILGNEESIHRAQEQIETVPDATEYSLDPNIKLYSIKVDPQHQAANKMIRDSQVSELVGGIIVGVERGGDRILNPAHSFQILPDDFLWVVGVQPEASMSRS